MKPTTYGTSLRTHAPARAFLPRDNWAIEDYLSYLLARASHGIAGEFHAQVKAAGFTVLEWRVLATLADGQERSVGDLADIVLAHQPTLTKLLDRMDAEQRVTRTDSPYDRRQTLVRITPAGLQSMGDLLERSKSHEREAFAALDLQEASGLKSALQKLISRHARS